MSDKRSTRMRLMKVLADLHTWEVSSFDFLRSVAGRQLYFEMVRQIARTQQGVMGDKDSLKDLYYGDGVTISERGARMKLREFEKEGIVSVYQSGSDKRSKFVMPSNELIQKIDEHGRQVERLLGEELLLLIK